MRVPGLVALLVTVVVGQQIQLKVIESQPEVARRVAAAAAAGLRAAEGRARAAAREAEEVALRGLRLDDDRPPDKQFNIAVKVQSVEANEVLDVPNQVCIAAQDQEDDVITHAVLTGVGAGAVLGRAAAARAGLPLLLVGNVPEATSQWEALAMYPRADLMLMAAKDLIKEKGWQKAALLHAGSARPAALLAPDTDDLKLFVRQLPPPGEDALLRDLMLVLKKAGYVNFVVWSDEETAWWALDAAQRVGLLAARHAYLVLSFELHTQDLEPFSHGGANITGLMFFDPEANSTIEATEAYFAEYQSWLNSDPQATADSAEELASANYTSWSIPGALLVSFDAALLAGGALRALALPPPPPRAPARGSCDTGVAAFHADTLLNYIRSETDYGATGVLSWESDGWRRNNVLQVTELQRGGALEAVGSWTERDGVTWHRKQGPPPELPRDSMANRTFKVLIAMMDPYVMKKKVTERLTGNARYEGFCIELIQKLAEILHFNYTFVEQPDNIYGGINEETGEWEGMLRAVMDDKDNLTLAITDLTITELREKVVDFTTPFMNLGISILFKKPATPEPELFAFLLPFSSGVWVCLGVAYIGTSLMLYLVGRLCPEEWQNPYPCVEEPDALENQFTLGNAFWFNLGAVLLQGSEIAPVGYSTRAVAGVWWLFALVITSSYTANLATLLAQKSSNEVIKNVYDLVDNPHGITYGAKDKGSTYTFFESSQDGMFQKMFQEMKKQKLPRNNRLGIEKVEKENYAFLMESTSIEYEVERNCAVYMVGDLLDNKGYGIAMAKYSPYRQELNLALLRLQESGELREMKHTWWEERNGGGACKVVESTESKGLEMNSFYGLFVVLVVGCFFGVLLSCSDLALFTFKHRRDPEGSYWQNFAQEIRFVFHFDQSAKPVRGPLIPPKTPSIQSSQLVEVEAEAHSEEGDDVTSDRGGGTGGGGEGEAGKAGEAGEAGEGGAHARNESALSFRRRRRRSSMQAASARLARHARKDSAASATHRHL